MSKVNALRAAGRSKVMIATGSVARRRPADRKQRIIAAAADLFRDRGYHDVSLSDVAEIVGISRPALYKHFRNKEELLRRAADHGIDDLGAAIAGAATIDEFIAEGAAATRERHNLVALRQREARHLPAEQRRELRDRVRRLIQRVGTLIRAARPMLNEDDADFLALAVLSVFASLANHRTSLPRRQFETLLTRLSHVVVNFRLVPEATARSRNRAGAVSHAQLTRGAAVAAARRHRQPTREARPGLLAAR